MTYIMVDVESDGPIPGDYSMISFGAVVVEPALDRTFYGRLRPVSERWIPESLAVSGHTREQTLAFDDPKQVMTDFVAWIANVTKDTFTNFKHLRRTAHTHHPVDDAKGNAEALLHMKEVMGLKIKL